MAAATWTVRSNVLSMTVARNLVGVTKNVQLVLDHTVVGTPSSLCHDNAMSGADICCAATRSGSRFRTGACECWTTASLSRFLPVPALCDIRC